MEDKRKTLQETFLGYFTTLSVTPTESEDYMASDDGLSDEWWIWKYLEGSGCGLIEALPRHFLEGTEENHENLSQDSWCPARNSTEHLSNTRLQKEFWITVHEEK
jgi:hypothetical protein